jgi:hypothetical protein
MGTSTRRVALAALLFAAPLTSPLTSVAAASDAKITILKSRFDDGRWATPMAVTRLIRQNIDLSRYREVKAQLIFNADHAPDHFLVYLLEKGKHSLAYARIDLDHRLNAKNTQVGYQLDADDRAQQPGPTADDVKCPDDTVQFVALCPNDDQLEIDTTNEVAAFAESHKLKTVRLLQSQATRAAYLNYMSCPNLLGNFYDGDSDPSSMVVVDGSVTAEDFSTVLKGKFQLKTVNVWIACNAYNDPFLSAVQKDAKAKKFAAGINSLDVGPADKAGACAMEDAISGKPMTAAFQACYQKDDTPDDIWGFGGDGTDLFWN